MKLRIIFPVFFVLICIVVQGKNIIQKFDKSAFYTILRTGKVSDINTELTELSLAPIPAKEAYEGTLLMRKAGLVAIPAEKLKYFKAGRIKLETVLVKDSTNAEFRFLRLIIQEHAPKIVKYNQQLGSDKAYILKSYKSLSPVVQHAITEYSQSSKIIHPQDF